MESFGVGRRFGRALELHEWPGIAPHQWPYVATFLPRGKPKPFRRRDRKGGRPPLDDRRTFAGMLWLLRSGARWKDLPKSFGSERTVRRRVERWYRTGALSKAWTAYLRMLGRHEVERWGRCFEGARLRREPYWRFELEYAYRLELGIPIIGL